MNAKVRLLLYTLIFGLICWAFPCGAQEVEKTNYFYTLSTKDGLADNQVLQMMQLSNGNMAVETSKGINIYDGKRFHFIPLPPQEAETIAKYKGHTHLYADGQNHLWSKCMQKIYCVDLQRRQLVRHPLHHLLKKGLKSIDDLFIDSKGDVWYVVGDRMTNATNGKSVLLEKSWGNIQDMDVEGNKIYTFHDKGVVVAFREGKVVSVKRAYPATDIKLYQGTSLVTKTPNGQFYQIRTGYDRNTQKASSIFLHFNPQKNTYERIFDCDYILHTLNMSSDNQALISCEHGYLMFDFRVGNAPREVKELALPNGKSLVTGINTIYKDQDGGIWLGTYNDGLIYVSPMLGLFFTIDKPWWKSEGMIAVGLFALLLIIGVVMYLVLLRKSSPARAVMEERQAKIQVDTTGEIKGTEKEEMEPELLKKVRELMEQHLSDCEYGVEQLAHDLNMERTGLYKKFTSVSSTTPIAFIKKLRMQQAAKLLKQGL